mmetsp:Transcript_7472/g.26153  ORF Transcript_7472/g.26153 Transcript_7472/m.26153 type:complete len:290 (+) Transcript_7472:118-987(+)
MRRALCRGPIAGAAGPAAPRGEGSRRSAPKSSSSGASRRCRQRPSRGRTPTARRRRSCSRAWWARCARSRASCRRRPLRRPRPSLRRNCRAAAAATRRGRPRRPHGPKTVTTRPNAAPRPAALRRTSCRRCGPRCSPPSKLSKTVPRKTRVYAKPPRWRASTSTATPPSSCRKMDLGGYDRGTWPQDASSSRRASRRRRRLAATERAGIRTGRCTSTRRCLRPSRISSRNAPRSPFSQSTSQAGASRLRQRRRASLWPSAPSASSSTFLAGAFRAEAIRRSASSLLASK